MKCAIYYPDCSTIATNKRPESLTFFEGLWKRAAEDYAAEFMGKNAVGARTPKGIQKYLNEVIARSMSENGWRGGEGRFFKDSEWVRVSFRHSMSLGSDLLDALRLFKTEEYERLTIIGASKSFLKLISPSDAGSLCSGEDYRAQIGLNSAIMKIPICVGILNPISQLDRQTNDIVLGKR